MAKQQAEGEAATIFDVAREAGVSYATVSRVINNKAHVRPEKREAVLQAMARLGYVANQQARRLAGGRSRVIGLLTQELGTGYMGEIVRGIDEELAAAEYDLMLYTTHRHKAREAAFVASIARGMADGLLLVLPRNPQAYLASLRQRGFPYVLIDHQGIGEGEPSVGATNRQGAYAATRYLLGLGHRRIGFITGALELRCAVDRLEGYRAALADAGVPADPGLLREGDFLRPLAYRLGRELLERPDRPSAIFASNDVSALAVMDAARDLGLRIPANLSIVGFDDIPLAGSAHPGLTTVRQPLEQMGRQATRLLLASIERPGQPIGRLELPTELVVRASCAAPA